MAILTTLLSNLTALFRSGGATVYPAYALPPAERQALPCLITALEQFRLEEPADTISGWVYPAAFTLRITAYGGTHADTEALTALLEEHVLSPLLHSAYAVCGVTLSPLTYDTSLRRMKLEATVCLKGQFTETEEETA